MLQQDHYRVLNIAPSADLITIKKAYRRLARVHHPDVNGGSKQAEETFKSVQLAYKTLTSSALRAKFDREFGYGKATPQRQNATVNPMHMRMYGNSFTYRFTDLNTNEDPHATASSPTGMQNAKKYSDIPYLLLSLLLALFMCIWMYKTPKVKVVNTKTPASSVLQSR